MPKLTQKKAAPLGLQLPEVQDIAGALRDLKRAHSQLLQLWSDYHTGPAIDAANDMVKAEYPFHKSFDELYLDVVEWTDEMIEEINKNA